MLYVDDYGIEKDNAYIIQLLVVMGKFHTQHEVFGW